MKLADMPHPIQSFIGRLLARNVSVWLMGSRVNPTDKAPSDWDFMIFGSEEILSELSCQPPVPDVDALVVVDGDKFVSPWPRASDGALKCGKLSAWKWQQISPEVATYSGTKWPHDWGSTKKATRIHD